MKQSYSAGEIVMVNLGELHEVGGHEQAKYRPCVVIKSFSSLELVIVLPVTSSTKLSLYTIVPLAKGVGGLVYDSHVLCHQIRTVSFDRITERIGKLENRDYLKIQAVLSDTLELG